MWIAQRKGAVEGSKGACLACKGAFGGLMLMRAPDWVLRHGVKRPSPYFSGKARYNLRVLGIRERKGAQRKGGRHRKGVCVVPYSIVVEVAEVGEAAQRQNT